MNNIDLIMKQNIRSWNPSPNDECAGKHMVCNICDIQKKETLCDLSKIADIIDIICQYNGYDATQSMYKEPSFDDNGCSLIYILTMGYHISIHTFPEKNSLAFDLYISNSQYSNDNDLILIYEFLVEAFQAGVFTSTYNIMERDV
jgi:S-adenosylmethionine/arginine decarboxylase-like enzyme